MGLATPPDVAVAMLHELAATGMEVRPVDGPRASPEAVEWAIDRSYRAGWEAAIDEVITELNQTNGLMGVGRKEERKHVMRLLHSVKEMKSHEG